MALNIKDPHAERLAGEVAALADETKTRAVVVALQERRERLGRAPGGVDRLRRFLETEVWPQVPEDVLGTTITRAERENILGYADEGA